MVISNNNNILNQFFSSEDKNITRLNNWLTILTHSVLSARSALAQHLCLRRQVLTVRPNQTWISCSSTCSCIMLQSLVSLVHAMERWSLALPFHPNTHTLYRSSLTHSCHLKHHLEMKIYLPNGDHYSAFTQSEYNIRIVITINQPYSLWCLMSDMNFSYDASFLRYEGETELTVSCLTVHEMGAPDQWHTERVDGLP